MFISIPKEFFVPVLFSDDFRYNSESNAMEYETECESSTINNINRKKLQDLDFMDHERADGVFNSGITPEYVENMINIDDKIIEEQISNYAKSFMKFIAELKKANCLGKNEADSIKLINYYARSFRNLYDEYNKLIINVSMPISSADEAGIIDEFIGKLEDIYNENIKALNCKNLNYDAIEAIIDEISNDARDILKEKIKNINCELVNIRSSCKSGEEIRNEFNNEDKIYQKIDEEFVIEMKNS